METDIQVQEAQRGPSYMNPKRPTQDIKIKMSRVKNKERILETAREKQLINYKGAPPKLSANFLTETLQARRDW